MEICFISCVLSGVMTIVSSRLKANRVREGLFTLRVLVYLEAVAVNKNEFLATL